MSLQCRPTVDTLLWHGFGRLISLRMFAAPISSVILESLGFCLTESWNL